MTDGRDKFLLFSFEKSDHLRWTLEFILRGHTVSFCVGGIFSTISVTKFQLPVSG